MNNLIQVLQGLFLVFVLLVIVYLFMLILTPYVLISDSGQEVQKIEKTKKE